MYFKFKTFPMKKLLLLIIFTASFFISNAQSNIENFIEGRRYKNYNTGLIIQYGYISSLNTYGIIFTNKYGNKYYFMNL